MLFKKERYSKDAFKLQYKVDQLLAPVFKEYIKRGYSVRDISHLVLLAVFELEIDNVMDYSYFSDEQPEGLSYLEEEQVKLNTLLLFRTLIGLVVGLVLGVLSHV